MGARAVLRVAKVPEHCLSSLRIQAIISLWLSEDGAPEARMVVTTTSYEKGRAFRRMRQY
jgi:hypothetical protein